MVINFTKLLDNRYLQVAKLNIAFESMYFGGVYVGFFLKLFFEKKKYYAIFIILNRFNDG